MMSSKKQEEPCKEGAQKCLWKHNQKEGAQKCLWKHNQKKMATGPTTPPASFFKVMIGEFEECMFIPPKFSQTLQGLVKKNIYLKDYTGSMWMVKLSVIDGSMAFEYGWNDFVLSHSITVGEILTFRRTSITDFSVHIYSTSGSERVCFDEEKGSDYCKRKREINQTSPGNYPLLKSYESSGESKEKHHAISNQSKKDMVGETDTSDIVGNGIAKRICVSNSERHYPSSLHKIPRHNMVSGSLQCPSRADFRRALKMNTDQVSYKVKEAGKKSEILLVDDQSDDEDIKATKTTKVANSPFDKSKGLWKAATEEYGNDRGNLGLGDRLISNYFLTKERKSYIADKYLVCKQEIINVPPISSVNPEAFPHECNSQNTNSLLVSEGKLSKLSNEDDGIGRTETVTLVECAKSETETQLAASWAIIKHPVNEEEMVRVGCSKGQYIADEDWSKNNTVQDIGNSEWEEIFMKMDDDQVVGNGNGSPPSGTFNCVDEKETDCKYRGSDGETCDNVGEDINHKHEELIDASIDMAALEDCMVSGKDKVDLTSQPSPPHEQNHEIANKSLISNCNRDAEGSSTPDQMGNSGVNESEGTSGHPHLITKEVGASKIGITGSSPSAAVDLSGFANVQNVMEESSCQPERFVTGLSTGEFQEVHDKTVTPCSKIVPENFKTEAEDLTDIPLPACANFRITVSVISQFWLLLPERLPARLLLKKRHERRVVVLRDPSMQVWPVLYHESICFRGFIAGWEEFATKNNLQQGDTCEIESSPDESEQPMFLVRIIRKAPNPEGAST
ncbi:B3 domain-containing protein-like [Iris pallida]|uniref:B3 domain-containing protein-like n=1 Tax=Iris pallida TaxID=29817 RepID=A0AAX6G859_IRIPA|nr:B3 domain-containing protein-like [Iris pallida]